MYRRDRGLDELEQNTAPIRARARYLSIVRDPHLRPEVCIVEFFFFQLNGCGRLGEAVRSVDRGLLCVWWGFWKVDELGKESCV